MIRAFKKTFRVSGAHSQVWWRSRPRWRALRGVIALAIVLDLVWKWIAHRGKEEAGTSCARTALPLRSSDVPAGRSRDHRVAHRHPRSPIGYIVS